MYRASADLGAVVDLCKQLLKLHLYRYKILVDNSEKGTECTYAKLTLKYFLADKDKELALLIALRDKIDLLIGAASDIRDNQDH